MAIRNFADEEQRQIVFTTQLVSDTTNKINDGVILKRILNPWFKGEVGVRRTGLSFKMSETEINEYIRCKIDILYYAEKYCKIKTEDGSVQNIKLRDYQREILKLYSENRFSILAASRQCGKTINASIAMLHFITFNNDKNIMISANIRATTIEIIDKIKNIYIQLPFFLKVGIKNWNQQSIIFENGCRIKSSARSKTPAIGFTIDFLYLDEFAHIPSNIIEPYYTAAFPTVSAIENSKIIITSTPNGMNLFYRLLSDAERSEGDPLKNSYKSMRIYWYQVPGRFVTYVKLNASKLFEYDISKEDVYKELDSKFGSVTKVELRNNKERGKDIIHVFNNEKCSDQDIRSMILNMGEGKEMSIHAISDISTWKEEAVRDIGGEDAFNQEYGLRFINATRSLLSESIIEGLLESKKEYVYRPIECMEKKLKFQYDGLTWVNDPDDFKEEERKSIYGIISIDISEGLGQDYSIINIMRIVPKSDQLMDIQRSSYTEMSDFFCLKQIGIFRSNFASVKQLSEIFYLLCFEYFNYENFRVVIELNNYGNEFLAHLPNIFDGNNNYGSSVFFRYKHRSDSNEEKIGLKVGDNKNMLVKSYQEAMDRKDIIVNHHETIKEITTFVKHITSAGNIRYAADTGNDDIVMTLVNASSVFDKYTYKEIVLDYAPRILPESKMEKYEEILKRVDYKEILDYSSIIEINKRRRMDDMIEKSKLNIKNWFVN